MTNCLFVQSSLVDFIQNQPFRSPIFLDMSDIKFMNPIPQNPFKGLKFNQSTGNIESIRWNGNPISASFIHMLASQTNIQEVMLNYCKILPADETSILPSISNLISSTSIRKLSLNETLRYFKSLMKTITLQSLNFCNNLIGDRGLKVL